MNAGRRSSGAPVQSSTAIVPSAPIQSDAAEMCTQSAISVSHDEPGIAGAVVPRHREPADEHDGEDECRNEEDDAVEQPREKDERQHEREDERHRHERLAEAGRCHRREVAVQEPAERQLQRVLGAQRERRDPRLQSNDAAEARGDRDAAVERLRHREAAQHDQPQPERADRQREPDEPEPANDVLGLASGRPRRTRPRPPARARARRTSRRRRRRASRRRSPASERCSRRRADGGRSR